MDPTDPRDGALSPGAHVGPYVVTGRIGSGGMGEVYRAHDARFGRDVAIKVLPVSYASDPERLRRFEQEARAAGSIDNPGILVVHDFGAHDGRPYLATELLEGESLRERLRWGVLPARKAVDLTAQIARGLAAAHEKGIVHRDLKPDNVFLTREGRAKILDFGLAKVTVDVSGRETETTSLNPVSPAPGTHAGALLGTVGYLSPEQARGSPADARSDIFALGTVFFEMVTGRRAFARGSTIETLNAILTEDVAEMTTATGPVPPPLERLCRRCLEKDPDERFQTARDLAFALEAVSTDHGSGAVGSLALQTDDRDHRNVGRLMRVLGLIGLGALLLAAAAWLVRPPPPPRITGSRALLNGFGNQIYAPVVTDGDRVYFSMFRDGRVQSFQVSLAGGEPAPLILPTRHAIVCDVSKKRSALLALGWDGRSRDIYFHDVPLWVIPLPAGSPTRLGVDGAWATWSPDGETIAYSGGSDNYARKGPGLLTARADGSSSRSLWAQKNDVWPISWSSDGRRLLVQYVDRGKKFDRGKSGGLDRGGELPKEAWVAEMPSDGHEAPRPLMKGWARWTPDRRYLIGQVGGAVTSAQTPSERRRVNLTAQRRWRLADLWREPQPVTLSTGPLSLSGPIVTPDGRKILAVGSLSRMEPLRFNRTTGQFERLPGGIPGGFIDYTHDGQWVAWVDANDRTLWRARRDGGERLQLTLPPLQVGLVKWAPDGRRLAFVGSRDLDLPDVVYLVSRDGGAPEAVSKPDPASVWDPCWLPDGQTLVWGNLDESKGLVRTLDTRTRQLSVIPGSEGMMSPKCSPQGTILAAKEWVSGWWLYSPDTRAWREIVPASSSVHVNYPTWSRDGRFIYGLSLDERAIVRLRADEFRPERFAGLGAIEPTAPWMSPWMGLDSEDAPLVLRDTGMSDIYVLDWEAP